MISRKHRAEALLEWTHKVETLLLIYIVEVTGMKTPTVSIDGKVAKEYVSEIQQGKEVPRSEYPRMSMAVTDAREIVHQEQGEEEVRGRASINTEDQGDFHDASKGRGDTAEWEQGGLPHPDNYIQDTAIKPPTVD